MVVAVAFLYFGLPLLAGRTFGPVPGNPWIDIGAAYWVNASMAELVRDMVTSGSLPLWNPYTGIGAPLFSDPHNAMFSPFSWMLYLHPDLHGWDAMIVTRWLVLVWGTLLVLRRTGVPVALALVFALLFGFSGHIMSYLHHFHVNSLALAPLLLWAWLATLEGDGRAGAVTLAVAGPLMVFGGGLLDVVLVALYVLMLGTARWLAEPAGQRTAWLRRALRRCLPPLVVALLIAGVFLVPYLELRTVAVAPYADRSRATFDDLWYALGMFYRDLAVTPPDAGHWLMRFRQYLPVLVLPGAALSPLALRGGAAATRAMTAASMVFAAFYFVRLYGLDPTELVDHLPLLRDVRFPKYQGLYMLAWHVLAAVGYARVVSSRGTAAPVVLAVVAVLCAIGAPAYAWRHDVAMDARVLVYALLPLSMAAAVVAARAWHGSAGRLPASAATALAIIAAPVAAGQVLVDAPFGFAARQELFPEQGIHRLVRGHADGARVFPMIGYEYAPRTWAARGIRDVRNHSVVYTQRYFDFFKRHVEHRSCWHFFILCSENPAAVDLPLVRFLGAGHLVLRPEQLPALRAGHADGPADGPSVVGQANGLLVVDIGRPRPLFTVADEYIVTSAAGAESAIVDSPDIAGRRVVLERPPPAPLLRQPGAARITAVERGINRLAARVSLAAPAMVVVASQHFPGWKAYVDGEATPLQRADYLFQAVRVPAGDHRVEIVYRPWSLPIGCALTVAGLLSLPWLARGSSSH